ncbi:hemolysin D [Marinobacter sp. EhC06]|jgi:HlyD family secretion protein|uniref:HlyD family secretion protein n=1 Tax=Marinobacter TaxID=2742 RepID=UPI0007D93E2E|nr:MULTISPECIES: HlyD family efflux transporter periplasmic adaptor subunit [unclassified Marinobacter]OAN90610.1 hemolysin D [Marinobacter sp. EhN04]OAN92749.1 hemolysin D [Marinobacter sp. EhC06]
MTTSPSLIKKLLVIGIAAGVAAMAWWGWLNYSETGPGEGFVSGNGRIEATEIDVATKLPGRVEGIFVREGDFVEAGQPLAQMQLETLEAQRNEALAMRQQAMHMVSAAQAQVALREADVVAALAFVDQRESEFDAAQRRLKRSQTLSEKGAASIQQLDDDRAQASGARAAVSVAKAQAAAARAAVEAAKAQLVGARSTVSAATATIDRIEAEIRDSELRAPRDGRVQIRVAEPGEVLGAGGRVLNLIDLTDVYMTFFLPETVAGRVGIGSEVRIVLDAAPDYVIPATISYVASAAQFTPKTVETASERQKLMFRVRAQISPELLHEHLRQVKTGLPGVAWVRLDTDVEWPGSLDLRVPE